MFNAHTFEGNSIPLWVLKFFGISTTEQENALIATQSRKLSWELLFRKWSIFPFLLPLGDTMCFWTQPALDQKACFLGDFADRRAWPAQKATVIWWRLHQWNGMMIQLVAAEQKLLCLNLKSCSTWWAFGFVLSSLHYDPGGLDSCLLQFAFLFSPKLNRESWRLQRTRGVFTTHKCCSSWSCIDFSRQNCYRKTQ